jgi:hypothetical protein
LKYKLEKYMGYYQIILEHTSDINCPGVSIVTIKSGNTNGKIEEPPGSEIVTVAASAMYGVPATVTVTQNVCVKGDEAQSVAKSINDSTSVKGVAVPRSVGDVRTVY